jgi:cytochrome c oxidase subunit I
VTAPATPTDTTEVDDGGDDAQPIHPAPTGFLRRYVFSVDHKVIGRQFLFLGLVFLAVRGWPAASG